MTHVPGYATDAAAEYAFGLLLASIRRLLPADKHVREGEFDWRPFSGTELAGFRRLERRLCVPGMETTR